MNTERMSYQELAAVIGCHCGEDHAQRVSRGDPKRASELLAAVDDRDYREIPWPRLRVSQDHDETRQLYRDIKYRPRKPQGALEDQIQAAWQSAADHGFLTALGEIAAQESA